MDWKRSTGFGALLLGAIVLVGSAPTASAATITVGPGGPTPACTLIDAVDAANLDAAVGACPAGSGADSVVLTGDVVLNAVNNIGSGAGGNGLPRVLTDIAIDGGGFKIQRDAGAPDFRILNAVGANLELMDIVIENGSVGQAGGVYAAGGAVTLTRVTLAGNSAGLGAALYLSSGADAFITDSTLTDNSASSIGGAVYINTGSTVVIERSTLSGNDGGSFGGAVFINTGGELFATNSTFSGNAATNGGAIHNTGSTLLTHCTVTNNSATSGGGVSANTAATVSSSIVANNLSGGDCGGITPVTDGGSNLSSDATCGAGFGSITGLAAALGDNGGPTQTHALLPGSSAIDTAGACGLATDQRGEARSDGACDSGAYEFDPAVQVPVVSGWSISLLAAGLLLALLMALTASTRAGYVD